MDLPAPLGEAALSFFQKLLGPVGEAGEFLTDKIRFYRWKSALKTIERARAIAHEKNLSIREVPLKFLIPFMEKSSLEEENSDFIERWATLLATASDNFGDVSISFVDVLSKLSGREVGLIEKLIPNESVQQILQSLEKNSENSLDEIVFIYAGLWNERRVHYLKCMCQNIFKDSKEWDIIAYKRIKEEVFPQVQQWSKAVVESISFRFGTAAVISGKKKTTLFDAQGDLVVQASSLDVLISTGLITRNSDTFDFGFGTVTISSVYPTPLGMQFVMACRGDRFGHSPNAASEQP